MGLRRRTTRRVGVTAAAGGARGARWVTYGLLGLLLTFSVTDHDSWPLTAYRLFSMPRSDHGASNSLVAWGTDGTRTVLTRPDDEVAGTTSHLYDDMARSPQAEAREMVDAWLDLAGLDRDDVEYVTLERATWVMDPDTRETRETGREVVAEVRP